ncbi:glycerol-3-phosphate acyltransferase [Lysinibacillus sp. SGAir0095]|uniref:glycerol-3-phosphate acyltransferase n=1 Tax=Lysinibacillus sp. SGAir0095 TaxID=2070463 RepID=UPI0010CD243F|nr:glycerol-3-phosphate acyltransferase [Lysinibacillus sp. SGAir0095]QCR30919.1 glycerol-3-phosphate acyltransferase 1 [Lysinibacillus sp. SGAir0095]
MLYAIIFILLAGYLIGCIHGSNIAKLLSGVNLKEVGHGNAGASNATLSLGWKYGVLVALIDIGKGIVAIVFIRLYLVNFESFTLNQTSLLLYLTGAAVILGHNFPIHMRFRGGKGTASLIGIFIALNWKLGLIAVLAFVITSLLTNYLLIGVGILYIIFAVTALLIEPTIGPFIITLTLLLIALYLHIENINRMRLGTEPKVTAAFKKKR